MCPPRWVHQDPGNHEHRHQDRSRQRGPFHQARAPERVQLPASTRLTNLDRLREGDTTVVRIGSQDRVPSVSEPAYGRVRSGMQPNKMDTPRRSRIPIDRHPNAEVRWAKDQTGGTEGAAAVIGRRKKRPHRFVTNTDQANEKVIKCPLAVKGNLGSVALVGARGQLGNGSNMGPTFSAVSRKL